MKSLYTTERQKKNDIFHVDGHCDFFKTVFEARYHFCSCQEIRPYLPEQDIEKRTKKREMDELRREYKKQKVYKTQEMGRVSSESNLKQFFCQESCHNKIFHEKYISTDSLFKKIKNRFFLAISNVCRNDIGEYMKRNAEEMIC